MSRGSSDNPRITSQGLWDPLCAVSLPKAMAKGFHIPLTRAVITWEHRWVSGYGTEFILVLVLLGWRFPSTGMECVGWSPAAPLSLLPEHPERGRFVKG